MKEEVRGKKNGSENKEGMDGKNDKIDLTPE